MDRTLHLFLPNPSFPLLSTVSPPHTPPSGRLRRHRPPSLHRHSLPASHFKVRTTVEGGGEGGSALAMEGSFCGNGTGSELPVELSLTMVLPPALTLEEGGRRIKEAVADIRSSPPGMSSGIVRFQVAVPPSVKSLTWLLCQSHSSVGYPHFYLSGKVVEELSWDFVSQDEFYGVSGIGLAVYFTGSSRSGPDIFSSVKRYLSIDSPLIRAYGIVGTYFDMKSSVVERETDSRFFFIPQIELDEFEAISILAATMAWDDCSICTFEKAAFGLECSLNKALFSVYPIGQVFYNPWIIDVCQKSSLIDVKNTYLAILTANFSIGREMIMNLRHLVFFLSR